MNWTRGEIVRCGGPLGATLANARLRVEAREGLWLRLVDEDGHVGIGECAPLPGFSSETLDDCRAALGRWLEVRDERLPAAARCAVQTALLDLRGQATGKPSYALLANGPARAVPLAALVASMAEAEAALKEGIRTLKLKVGIDTFDQEVRLLRDVRRAVGSTIALRIDANGSLPPEGLRSRLEALAEFSPEFVEEPTSLWSDALEDSPVPLAIDESLQRGVDPRALALASVAVLKPMLLGGPNRCLALAETFAEAGRDLVVSHCWDGPVGLAVACTTALAIAVRWPERLLACGLRRHGGLAAWPERGLPFLGSAEVTPFLSPGLGVVAT